MAAPQGSSASIRRKPLLREYLEALLIAVIFATFARAFVVQAFKIPSSSMEQSLLVGDHILVNKFIYAPSGSWLEGLLLPKRPVRRGDVVVFKFPQDPERDFIKRCVGLPGDTVEIRNKQLFINGEAVDESGYTYFADDRVYRGRLVEEPYRHRDNYGPYTVPEQGYFCLGDNRDASDDSRFWGPVPALYVKGRAVLIYWSLGRDEARRPNREPGPRSGVPAWARRPIRALQGLFANSRWERTLRIVR